MKPASGSHGADGRAPCPCGSGAVYDRCCGPVHRGEQPAASPLALMRSRYSAFVRHDADWLRQSWHASRRPATIDVDPALRWLRLEIVQSTVDEAAGTGTVEFVAVSKRGGRAERLHERSRFVREDGRWYYVDGDVR